MAGNDGLHNQIAQGIANIAQNVIGGTASINAMRYTAPTPVSNIPPAPATIVGPPRGRIATASWEVVQITYPVRVYTAKIMKSSVTQHDVNEWVDAFIAAYRTGITEGLSSLGVMEVIIESWDTDKFYEVGGEGYQAIDFVVDVEVLRTATYTN